MYIKLIAVGRLKESYWSKACAEYEKRLRRYHQLSIVEVADEKDPPVDTPAAIEALLTREETRIRQHIPVSSHVIALAVEGKAYDSEQLAAHFDDLESRGITHLTILIGGSNGLSKSLLRDVDEKLSFSALTFPHQLMRVIFLEQLYRISRISRGEPYHK